MLFSIIQNLFIDKFDMHVRNSNECSERHDWMNAIVGRHAIWVKSETVIVNNNSFLPLNIGSFSNNSFCTTWVRFDYFNSFFST